MAPFIGHGHSVCAVRSAVGALSAPMVQPHFYLKCNEGDYLTDEISGYSYSEIVESIITHSDGGFLDTGYIEFTTGSTYTTVRYISPNCGNGVQSLRQKFTIEGFVKFGSTGDCQLRIFIGNGAEFSGGTERFYIRVNQYNIWMEMRSNSASYATYQGATPSYDALVDVWAHFAISFDEENIYIAMNGQIIQVVSRSASIMPDPTLGTPRIAILGAALTYGDNIAITYGACRYAGVVGNSYDIPTSEYES